MRTNRDAIGFALELLETVDRRKSIA